MIISNIEFTGGLCYEVIKADDTIIRFKFIGDEPPKGKLLDNGATMTMDDILYYHKSVILIEC